jgi:hypothetical protein
VTIRGQNEALSDRAIERRLPGSYVAFTVSIVLLVAGCSRWQHELDLLPGETAELTEFLDIHFDVPGSANTVRVVSDRVAQLILVDAKWIEPEGISVEKRRLVIYPSLVSWSYGTYSAQGVRIGVSGVLTVDDSARSGEKELLLTLPALTTVGSLLGAVPRFTDDDVVKDADTVRVKWIRVYESNIGKLAAKSYKFIIGAAFVFGIILMLIFGRRSHG